MFASISNLLHRRQRGKEQGEEVRYLPDLLGVPRDDTPLAPPVGPRRGSSEHDVLVRQAAALSFEPLPACLQSVPGVLETQPVINVEFDERDLRPLYELIDQFAAEGQLNAETALGVIHLLDKACEAKCCAVDEQERQMSSMAEQIVADRHLTHERISEHLKELNEEFQLLDERVKRVKQRGQSYEVVAGEVAPLPQAARSRAIGCAASAGEARAEAPERRALHRRSDRVAL